LLPDADKLSLLLESGVRESDLLAVCTERADYPSAKAQINLLPGIFYSTGITDKLIDGTETFYKKWL